MARSTVKIDGFIAKLERFEKEAREELDKANREAAEIVQRHVVPRVPVDTGRTRDAFASPDAIARGRKGWRYGLVTEDLKNRGYKAPWLEFGTKGDSHGHPHAAQPFFRPGVEAAQGEVDQRWREAIRRAANKVKR